MWCGACVGLCVPQVMDRLAAAVAAGTPGITKAAVVETCSRKRDEHSALWTPEVAVRFRGLVMALRE